MSLLDNLPHLCTIQRRYRSRDAIGGSIDGRTVEQTNVACWEQQASASEISEFEKRGINVSRKVYFRTDPQVTERHEIVVTSRNGVAVSNPIALDVMSEPEPDASAGLGYVYRVMVGYNTGDQN